MSFFNNIYLDKLTLIQKCIEIYSEILNLEKEDYFANFNLALVYFNMHKGSPQPDQGLLEKALELLHTALKASKNTSVLFNLAGVHTELGNIEEASDTYQQILAMNLNIDNDAVREEIRQLNILVYGNLVTLSKIQGDHTQSRRWYKQGLLIDQKNFVFLYNISINTTRH